MLIFAALSEETLVSFSLFDKTVKLASKYSCETVKPDSGPCTRFDSDLEEQLLFGLCKMLDAPYLIPLSGFQNCCRG